MGFISNSAAIVERAGAIMVDTMMRLKPVAERTSVTAHLRPVLQFFGFSASKGSAKVTKNGSSWLLRLVTGANTTSFGEAALTTSGLSWDNVVEVILA